MRYAPSALTATVVALFFAAGAWGADDAATRSSEKLGRVLFKTSCSPEAKKQFERALAMQHSFFFPETIKTFSAIPQTDPSCAIAYWGIAISQRPNPLVGPFDSATLKRGLDAVEKGKAIGAKTQRERDWLAAIEAFYKDYEKVDQDTRTQNYAKAMEALAQNMPSHIYTMVGMWDASIASNQKAIAVANDYVLKANLDGTLAGVPHAYDFMAYAYLQLGQDARARGLIDETAGIKKIIGPRIVGMALAAVPARYVLERQDWQGAARLGPLGTGLPAGEAITYFARALGAARSGDVAGAQTDIDKLKEQRAALEEAKQSYWAEQVEVQILAAQAWLAQGRNDRAEALKLMRAAADLEDASEKHVAMENRLYPMRELLADMLMAQD